jgi:hypothetical protein
MKTINSSDEKDLLGLPVIASGRISPLRPLIFFS